ncbi:c-type cytochrome [Panacagrimonas sp.]|uniref:c-type cytochrome n=1 Tax=Panacagrimonas sp. TaxID=2480088 RepID=UPI003B525E0C
MNNAREDGRLRASLWTALVLVLAIAAPALQAAAPTDILNKNACSACHGIDKAIVGPAYQAVAEKYARDPKAKGGLAKRIREGGSGTWGPVPMPPQPNLSDADLATVVDWLLAGAKP